LRLTFTRKKKKNKTSKKKIKQRGAPLPRAALKIGLFSVSRDQFYRDLGSAPDIKRYTDQDEHGSSFRADLPSFVAIFREIGARGEF